MRLKARGAVARPLLLLLVLVVSLLAVGCGPWTQDGDGRPDSDGTEDDPSLDAAPVSSPGMFRSLGRLAFVRDHVLYVLDGDVGAVHRLTPPGQRASGPLWSNQGTWLAFTVTRETGRGSPASPTPEAAGGSLMLAWFDGSRRHPVTELPGPVGPGLYAWSPTADMLAAAPGGRGIWLVRPGYPPSLLLQPDSPIQELAWSPDGSTLAYIVEPRGAGDESILYTLRLGPDTSDVDAPASAGPAGGVAGTPEIQYRAGAAHLRLAGWWPDGSGLLFYQSGTAGQRDDAWRLMTLPLGGEVRELVPAPMPRRELVSWFPGEMRLLTVTNTGAQSGQTLSLAVCHAVSGQCRPYPAPAAGSADAGHERAPWAGPLSAGLVAPTGDRIAVVPEPGNTNIWLAGADDWGTDARALATGGDGTLSLPRWSGDGRYLLYVQDNTLWLHQVDGQGDAHPLVTPWHLPRQSHGSEPIDDKDAGAGDLEFWTDSLAWHHPVAHLPGVDRSGRVGPILVLPFAERGPDGIVTVSGKVSVAVAAEGARRVQFFAAPRDEEGPGVLFGEAAEPVEGRFTTVWEPPMGGEIFKLTAIVHDEGEPKRRTLLVRGTPESLPDRFQDVFTPLHANLVVQRPEGLPREFAAHGWLDTDRVLGSVGPFLVQHELAQGKTSALGVTGLEAGPGPGNGLVAYLGQDQGVYALDVDGGGRQLLWSMDAGEGDHFGEYLKPLWSPKGVNLLVPILAQGEPEYYVVRLSPPGVERLSTFREGYFTAEAVGWAGPGQIIFNAVQMDRMGRAGIPDRGSHIFVYHLAEHRYELLAGGNAGEAVAAIAGGPGGIVFRRVNDNGTTYGLMNLQGRVLWEESLGQVLAASPSPDGRATAFIKEKGQEAEGIRLVLSVYRDGREVELAELLAAEEVTGPFWSPDGQQLLFSFNSLFPDGQDEGPLAGSLAYYSIILTGEPLTGSW